MVFCQAGFGQLFCTEINYLSLSLGPWVRNRVCWSEQSLTGVSLSSSCRVFFFFFSLKNTQISQIHAAPGCFRNKLTSPEGWPSTDATDSALNIYALRLIIKEPWHKMNVNTHIYLAHSMFFSLIHSPFSYLNIYWIGNEQSADVEVRIFTLAAICLDRSLL